ncbi:MAG: hypothetical protein V5A56_07780 [Halolamina sp.]
MSANKHTYGERLWVEIAADRVATLSERIARRLGLTLPSDEWSSPVPDPYLLVGGVVLFDIFVLHTVQQLTVGRNTVLDNPSWLALPATVLLAVVTNRYARDRYGSVLEEIRIETRTATGSTAFRRLVPVRFKRAFFLIAVGGYYSYLVLSGRILPILEYEGVAGLFGWVVIIPFVYAPILVETAAIYLSLHVSLPRRFDREDVKIYYFDPHNLGGLRPVGTVLKQSYYLFTLSVVLITVLLYAPFLFPEMLYTPYQPPEQLVSVIVGGLWAVGVLSIAFSLGSLHRYMRKRRREELKMLESRFYDLISEPYDVRQTLKDSEELRQWEREKHRIEQVRDTREFPATIRMWSQILFSVVLPLGIQWAIQWFIGLV